MATFFRQEIKAMPISLRIAGNFKFLFRIILFLSQNDIKQNEQTKLKQKQDRYFGIFTILHPWFLSYITFHVLSLIKWQKDLDNTS